MSVSRKLQFKSTRKAASQAHHPVLSLPELTAFTKKIADRIELVAVADLRPHPRKTRVHDEKQIASIMGSFNQFGFTNPIAIDERNIVLAGDARLEAASRLGIAALPTIRIDYLSEAEKRAYKIADNRIAELAQWDLPELSFELTELVSVDFNMDALGFDVPTIDFIVGEAARETEAKPDPADEIPGAPWGHSISRPGDIWALGPHRVICGSALDADVMMALMGDRRARMVLTDAPYNVPVKGFVSGLGKIKHREFAMASGEMSKPEFLAFLTVVSALSARYLADGGLLYGFMDWRGLGTYMAALDACGLTQINLCVWNKGSGGMGSLYRSQHELCLVYKKGNGQHVNNVELGQNGRYRTNVWDHPGMASFGRERDEALRLHPTVKPINLLVEAIRDVSRQNEIILDPFLGSGSTLIAAHKSGRVCCGIEIDPLYVDTIVRRFEVFTGIDAVHVQTGRTFAELAAMRAPEAGPGADAADVEAEAEVTTTQPLKRSASGSSDEPPPMRIRQRSRNRVGLEVADV